MRQGSQTAAREEVVGTFWKIVGFSVAWIYGMLAVISLILEWRDPTESKRSVIINGIFNLTMAAALALAVWL